MKILFATFLRLNWAKLTQNRFLTLNILTTLSKLQVDVSMTNSIFCLRLFDLDQSSFK